MLSRPFSVPALTSTTLVVVLGPLPRGLGMVDLSITIPLTDAFTDGAVVCTVTPSDRPLLDAASFASVRPWGSGLVLVANGSSASFSWRVPLGRFDRYVCVLMPVDNTLNIPWAGHASIAHVPGTVQADRKRPGEGDTIAVRPHRSISRSATGL